MKQSKSPRPTTKAPRKTLKKSRASAPQKAPARPSRRKSSPKKSPPKKPTPPATAAPKRPIASAAPTSPPATAPRKPTPAPPPLPVEPPPPAPAPNNPDAARKTPPRKKANPTTRPIPALPAILFEDDTVTPPPAQHSDPGHRFDLGSTPPLPTAPATPPNDTLQLPESYGTNRLLLTPRDPFWLFAHWDFSFEHLRRFNHRSAHGHLLLRVHRGTNSGHPLTEIHLHPESREWFINVPEADTTYLAELGYYTPSGNWHSITQSPSAHTPAARISADQSIQFTAIPVETAVSEIIQAIQAPAPDPLVPPPASTAPSPTNAAPPPTEAVPPRTTASPIHAAPSIASQIATTPQPRWTPAQEHTFATIVKLLEHTRHTPGASEELLTLIRQQIGADTTQPNPVHTPPPAATSNPSSPQLLATSSPAPKNFWFNINAELVIYGATEPDANVTIAQRPIKLRPDGTFSYRFALPDGNFHFPVTAIAHDQSDARAAHLNFTRHTDYHGTVTPHPQDSALQPPLPQHLT